MDALHGPNVHVILCLKEGRGFGFLEHPVMIEATLNGHVLGTHIIPPSAEFVISVELMWEVAKKALRRFRTGNVSVKVEAMIMINQEKHDRIGYVMLNLRSAQIVTPDKNLRVSHTWHQLLGVKSEYKTFQPELLLTIHIEDAVSYTVSTASLESEMNGTNVFPPSKDILLPQSFEEEGIIQLGPEDTANEMFMLTIFVGEAVNLFMLTEDVDVSAGGFWFSCNVMGFTAFAGTLGDLNAFSADNTEKVVVKIRSTLSILRTFFTDVSVITIHLMQEQQEVAFVDVDITVLVPTSNIVTFCTQHAVNNTIAHINRCYMVKSNTGEIPMSANGSRPYIDVAIKLRYMNGCNDKMALAQGDVQMQAQRITDVFPSKPEANLMSQGDLSENHSTYTTQSEIHSRISKETDSNEKHLLLLDVTVDSILFYKFPPEKKFMFRFNKQKGLLIPAEPHEVTVEQLDSIIHIGNVKCSLKWESTLDEIHRTFMVDPPIIWLCCKSQDTAVPFACGVLDLEMLLVKLQKDCRCTIPCRNPVTEVSYGVMVVTMALKDTITEDGQSKHKAAQSTGIMDAQVAFKIVEELEEWKEHQEEQFLAELKKKEAAHINALTQEWEKRHREAECELKSNVESCTKLAESLNSTTEELRAKRNDLAHKEIELKNLETALQQEYILKVQEVREASRRMEDDHKLQMSKLEVEKVRLLERLEILEKENENLRHVLETYEQKFNRLQKGSLTTEQTASLLQELKALEEKHESALQSKKFFKEQWARAVREIHLIKSEHQKKLQKQLEQNRQELRNLGLQHMLSENQQEVSADQASLKEVQAEIKSQMVDDSSLQKCPDFLKQDGTQQSMSTASLQGSMVSAPSLKMGITLMDETEQTLERLVEERDSLLDTGNYTLDDPVIVKLNQDIRQLLI